MWIASSQRPAQRLWRRCALNNKSTEWRLRASLVRAGIRGWTMNPPDVWGKPDFAFRSQRVVFVGGCFWYGCRYCKRVPSSSTMSATSMRFTT
ncbi:MAG: hypothetical protein HYX27_25415 [Acidobacteria bacterium]|nr:hypothetical protein [Acidobacteriota bacterium]